MAKGIELILRNSAGVAIANNTGIEVSWFNHDVVVDLSTTSCYGAIASTDSNGTLKLDLDNVTGLSNGDWGFLIAYKTDNLDYRKSRVFAGRVQITSVTGGTVLAPSTDWVRNSAWLALPSVTGQQKFVGLHAVFPENANFVALSATGNYTVNWGDGSGDTNVNSGVTAERNIAWADAPNTSDVGIADAVAVTFTDTGDTVNRTAHGWLNGQRVAFSVITSTTGISTHTTYFVVNRTADTFQVASTIGGSAIALTTDGSGSVYVPRYRQVVVSVVPNATNILTFNLHVKHSQSGLQQYSSGWLDIAMSFEFMTDLRFGVQTPGASTQVIRHHLCESFSIEASDLRQLSHLFHTSRELRNIGSLVTSATAAATFAVTFTDAGDLVTATAHGFRNGDSCAFSSITSTTGITVETIYYVVGAAANTFQVASTYGGAALPLTTNGSGTARRGTAFSSTFQSCISLQSVPLFNTSSGTTFSSMFTGDQLLQAVPLFDTSSGAAFNSAFQACYALQLVPLLDTSSGLDFSSMFQSCYMLEEVPLLDTSSGTNFSLMFASCYSLQSVPLFDTSSGTNFQGMFNNCLVLLSVPLFNTAAGTNFASMFINCYSLRAVPLLDTSSGLTFSSMFNSCLLLESVPLFNTAASTSFSGMLAGCSVLNSVPLFNTALGASFNSMFSNCVSLQAVPAFNTAAGTSFSSMFSICNSLERGRLAGTTRAISYADCKLSATELNDIYTGLGTASGAQTITVTGNHGVTGDNPAIATGKGWTVTG